MYAARVVELADTQDLGSCAERCGGSSPPSRTKQNSRFRLQPGGTEDTATGGPPARILNVVEADEAEFTESNNNEKQQ